MASQEDSAVNQAGKILSVCWNAGALAASYYDIDQLELYAVQQAIEPRPQYVLLRDLVQRYRPLYYVITGPACFLEDCREVLGVPAAVANQPAPSDSVDQGGSNASQPSNVKIVEYTAQSQAQARGRLLAHKLAGMPPESSERECRTFLKSIVPFEQELLVTSVGNLLLLLDTVGDTLSPAQLVTRINLVTPSTQLVIDGLTYEALQIFDASRHPSGFKCGTDTRGLSVYSLFNKCSSKNGEEWLSRLMTQPIRDRAELQHRHDTVQWLLANVRYANQFDQCLKHLTNVGLLYRKLLQGTARNVDWKMLKKNLYYLYSLCKLCALTLGDAQVAGTVVQELGQYTRSPTNALKHVLYTIDKCLDLEKGDEENKVTIRAGLDPAVDRLREQYDGLREVVLESSRLGLETLQLDMANICVTYLPSFGFVISTQVDEQLQRSGIFQHESFDLVFQADNTAYFQISLCKQLNDEFGQMVASMIEHELAVQTRLTTFVGTKFPEVMGVFKLAGKLDALLSFATVAKMHRYVRPIVCDGAKVLQIQGGRHVVLEHRRAYRANDTCVGETNHHLVNVIAADTSVGKTTYLKEVAIICYLAHVGSFVPAAYAKIPLLDSIYTRLDHPESIFSGRSSFMSELYQMASLLQNATASSLVLIDEFGKGTNYLEGKSLLIASIEHLLKRGHRAPITFVTTKFTGIERFLPTVHRHLLVRVHRTPTDRQSRSSTRTSDTLDVTSDDPADPTERLKATYQLAFRAVAFAVMKYHQAAGGQAPATESVQALMESTPITRVPEQCLEISHPPPSRAVQQQHNRHANDDVTGDGT
ncbi:mutS protein homolog 5-like isoform X2 [Anopheles merus]|uniref:mutS protein homolog 5-like isoform X2 n=1 Tax=Anopheles merus TaxID=30066 RepID=UPI001BE49CF1|nr:mutS protein homolog 5-like isoform X2 [Anopheles merus]